MEAPEFSSVVGAVAEEPDVPSMLPVDSRANVTSPLRPGSTLVAYQPNGSSSPKTPVRLGKSQHLAQIRSLGLLHDLQEYISSVESLAAEQKRELEKVREEKRDMEKYLARSEAHPERSATVVDYSGSEVADLPPRMRAIVEDNRGLREMVRKYKYRTQSLEHQAQQQQSQVLALAEANERLKQSLAECSRTPAEVEREDALKRQLELKTRQLENLEHNLGVLRAKVDTDSKLYRQNLTAAAREKDALKRQLVAANKALEERDREMRALNVELRKARRGAPPTRAGMLAASFLPPGASAGVEDDDSTAAAAGGAAGTAAATDPAAVLAAATPRDTAPRDVPEERIHIMLLVVRDEVQVQVPVPVEVPVYITVPAPPPPVVAPPAPPPPLVLPTWKEAEEEEPQPEAPEAPSESVPALVLEPSAAAVQAESSVTAAGPEVAEAGGVAPPAPEPVGTVLDYEAALEPPSMDAGNEPEPVSEPTFAGLEPMTDTETDSGAGPSGLLPESTSEVALVASPGDHGGDGADETADGAAAAEPSSELEPTATGSGDAAPEAPEAESSAASGVGGAGGSPHVHSSAPLPVPYSRTNARALGVRAGGTSIGAGKQPHPPLGSGGAGAAAGGTAGAAGAHRKASNASSIASGGGSGKGAGLKAGTGSTSRRQQPA